MKISVKSILCGVSIICLACMVINISDDIEAIKNRIDDIDEDLGELIAFVDEFEDEYDDEDVESEEESED